MARVGNRKTAMFLDARQDPPEQAGAAELRPEQLERAKRGFTAALWSHRCPPDFIAAHREEIFALAQTEYVRALDKGLEVPEPVGWLINCAWRRAQNLITAINRNPESVPEEALLEEHPEAAPSAEQLVLDEDRARKVRDAVGALSVEERRLLALTYFSDNSVRAAARLLGLDPSKAKRSHKAALEHLHELLGVESSEALELDVAVAAWLSLGAGGSRLLLPGGLEGVLDRAGHTGGGVFARLGELARRLQIGGGSDAAGVLAGSGAGRAASACATVLASACLAGAGVLVGSGAGLGPFAQHSPAPRPQSAQASPTAEESPAVNEEAPAGAAQASPRTQSKPHPSPKPSSPKPAEADASQVRQQTDGFARAAEEAQAAPAPEAVPSAPPEPHPSPAAEAQATQQFGAFH